MKQYTPARTRRVVGGIAGHMAARGGPDPGERQAPAGGTALQRHLRGLLYAQLSNQTRWTTIAPKLAQVDALFFDYDKEALLAHPAEYYVEGLRALKCGNRCIAQQMAGLHRNIATLERIEAECGGLDAFVASRPAEELVEALAKPEGAYKLHHIGPALAWEYLRSAGVDAAKPDVHLCRLLGARRLGFSAREVAAEREVNPLLRRMAADAGMTVSALDDLLWGFCADGYGSVCTAKPACRTCPVRRSCNRDRRTEDETG